MITRIWHGRTRSKDADEYRKYTESIGVMELRSTPGNLGVQIWQQDDGDVTHIWVVSWWPNMEVIGAFAGDELNRARYFPEDEKFLLEIEPYVQHYMCYAYGQ